MAGAASRPVARAVPFERLHHLLTVPVRLSDRLATRFVLDTGIGVNLLERSFADRVGTVPTGRAFSGQRTSGQVVSVDLETVPSLTLGTERWTDLTVGIVDAPGLFAQIPGVSGFLSLDAFRALPFTIAPRAREVRLGEPGGSEGRAHVPLHLDLDGPSVSAFVDLRLPSGCRVRAEVDTGSDSLTLDTRYLSDFDRTEDGPGLERREGTDETGYRYVRYRARLSGDLALAERPEVAAPLGDVIFQKIIHEGLVGAAFLSAFDVTIDVRRATIGFAPPSPPTG